MTRNSLWMAGLIVAAAMPAPGVHAQIEGLLNKGAHHSDLKGMAGMASSPLASGSMSNVAGLLQYCIGNRYLSEDSAEPVKDSLMAKLPGEKSEDRGFTDGQKGVLHGSNGKMMDLAGGGVTADLARKACSTILVQAKSFL